MKYLVMLGDGMADWAVPQLDGKTPLDVANKPMMDYLAKNGDTGLVKTVPDGMYPGSDTANLSVMGYAPDIYYTGRSPLEAVSIGIDLGADDVAFRCNLVTIDNPGVYEESTMIDYSAGEITTEESTILINYLNEYFKTETLNLYPGVSYRHCLVLKNSTIGTNCTPPHDITLKPVKGNLPNGVYGDMLMDILKKSYDLLKDHPINVDRVKRGLNPANSCWFWGEGTRPKLSPFKEKFGVNGSVISAVDLIKGIGICASLNSIDVEGATGNLHTNFSGKADACINAYKNGDEFVYLHVEAPDECGHQGDPAGKVKAIELIDEKMLTPIYNYLKETGEQFRILLAPDHPTPLTIRTHCRDAVPFVIYDSNEEKAKYNANAYTEKEGANTGYYIDKGDKLMPLLIKG